MIKKIAAITLFSLALVALPAMAEDKEETQLTKEMKALNTAYKELRKGLLAPDPAKKDTYLGYLDTIIEKSEASKKLDPFMVSEIPEDQKEEFLKKYKAGMDETIASANAIKEAINAGDFEKAKTIANTDFKKQKSAGHKAFKSKNL